MNKRIRAIVIPVLLSVLISACGIRQLPEPTITPTIAASPAAIAVSSDYPNAISEEAQNLLNDLSGSDWHKAYMASFDLERLEGESLPGLIAMLERDEYIKLENTADLIYPGAETFYGHGPIINYELDWLSVRAGWVLETIAFENFGFSTSSINEDDLFKATIEGNRDVPLTEVVPVEQDSSELKKQLRQAAVANATVWWNKKCQDWNRLDALISALQSDNPQRILGAISWLRFGEAPITGFSKQLYIDEIFPIIQNLTKSSDPHVARQAQYLVDAYNKDEWWWYNQKK